MNRVKKYVSIILMAVLLLVSIPLYSNAYSLDEVIGSANSFLSVGEGQGDGPDLHNLSNMVSNVLLTIAFGVTLISTVIMAINFTIQSVEDKAKIKESMVPWLIGIIVSFGAYGIWRMTMVIFDGIF